MDYVEKGEVLTKSDGNNNLACIKNSLESFTSTWEKCEKPVEHVSLG